MDAMSFDSAPEARIVLSYQQRNITRDIGKHLLSITYSDVLSGGSDSLDIELEDSEGKWLDAWYPGHGDTLELSLGWVGGPLRSLGRFEIDEIELLCAPSVVRIRSLATGIAVAVRTTEHRAYEATTLDAVARQVAQRQGLTLTGRIEPIQLDRLTQQESDLEFLRQLADEYDYAFKVVGHRLVFHRIGDLARQAPVASLTLKDLAGVSLRDQIRTVPQKTEVKHREPAKKQLISYQIVNGKTVAVPSSSSKAATSADTSKQRKRSTSAGQAKARANADLARANRERTTGNWSCIGMPGLVSGNVVALAAAGKMGGQYLLTQSTHRLSRSGGYVVDMQVCRVAAPSIAYSQNTGEPDEALASYGIA